MAVLTFSNPTTGGITAPHASDGVQLITPSDTDTFERPVRVQVGATAGNLVVTPANGGANVTVAVAAFSVTTFRVKAVLATGTTATTLHALF